jgi:hypothetical protein
VEGHAARIRELEQHAQAVLSLANATIGEPAGDIFMIDSTYIKVHADARGAEAPYDLMLICRFESLEGMREYLNHPAHLEASAYIAGLMEQGASLCYDSPQDVQQEHDAALCLSVGVRFYQRTAAFNYRHIGAQAESARISDFCKARSVASVGAYPYCGVSRPAGYR